jgi:hypothetical protein
MISKLVMTSSSWKSSSRSIKVGRLRMIIQLSSSQRNKRIKIIIKSLSSNLTSKTLFILNKTPHLSTRNKKTNSNNRRPKALESLWDSSFQSSPNNSKAWMMQIGLTLINSKSTYRSSALSQLTTSTSTHQLLTIVSWLKNKRRKESLKLSR